MLNNESIVSMKGFFDPKDIRDIGSIVVLAWDLFTMTANLLGFQVVVVFILYFFMFTPITANHW